MKNWILSLLTLVAMCNVANAQYTVCTKNGCVTYGGTQAVSKNVYTPYNYNYTYNSVPVTEQYVYNGQAVNCTDGICTVNGQLMHCENGVCLPIVSQPTVVNSKPVVKKVEPKVEPKAIVKAKDVKPMFIVSPQVSVEVTSMSTVLQLK